MIPTYKCNNCKNPIEVVRFHCLVCQDTDHCEKCQLLKREEHNHPFIKYKNVPSSKQFKCHKQIHSQNHNHNIGSPHEELLHQISPFQNTGRNATSVYFNTPTQTPTVKNQSLANSIVYHTGSQGIFQLQNISRPSIHTQTLPSAPKQQQQLQQPITNYLFGNNSSLNQSQNINISINQYNEHIQNQHNQQSIQQEKQHIQNTDLSHPLNDIFTHQTNSLVYCASNIPQSLANQKQCHTYQNITPTSNLNSIQSHNSASFSNLQDIKVLNVSEFKNVVIEREQSFSVLFTVKNGGKAQFPEGGIFQGSDHYKSIKTHILPLRTGETQDIELSLIAPKQIQQIFVSFKVEFPINHEQLQSIGPRFDFALQTF